MADKKKFKDEAPTKRAPISQRNKQTMLAVIIRNPDVFEQVRDHMTDIEVRSMGEAYAAVYLGVRGFFDEYAEMPNSDQLREAVDDLINANVKNDVNGVELEVAGEFIDFAFDDEFWDKKDISTDKVYASKAIKIFKKWKHELVYFAAQEQLAAQDEVPIDLSETLQEKIQQIDNISMVDQKPADTIFPDGWMQKKQEPVTPTGFSPFDTFMGGGYTKQQVGLLLGPYSSCKTICAIKGALDAAKRAQRLTKKAKKAGRDEIHKSLLASYETPLAELRERCLAYLAKIPRDRLHAMVDLEKELRRGGEPLPYEKVIFREKIEDGVYFGDEYQRVIAAQELINKHLIFLDMVNSDPDKASRGAGGVRELLNAIRAEKKVTPNLVIETIWIDHLAAMIGSWASADEGSASDQHKIRLGLKMAPRQIMNWIAKPFNTFVMIMHQLSGEANKKIAAAELSHTDADECKTVAMFVDYAFTVGSKTKDGRELCVMRCTKTRHQKTKPPIVVQVRGEYNDVKDLSLTHTIENWKIVDRDEKETVVMPVAGSVSTSHKKPKKTAVIEKD